MSVLLEVVVGAVLSVLVTTGEVEKKQNPEEVRTEQVSASPSQVECDDNI